MAKLIITEPQPPNGAASLAQSAPAAPELRLVEGGRDGDERSPTQRAGARRADIEAAAVAEMNRTHACVLHGGQVVVVCDSDDGTHSLTSLRALAEWLACKPLYVPELSERTQRLEQKRVCRATTWKGHPDRRNVRGIQFAPELDLGPDYYNTWRGWGLASVHDDAEAAAPILDHITSLWCGGDAGLARWVLGWLAQAVQAPCRKPGTALVLRGEEGTGKGIIAGQLMRRIFGDSFVQVLHPGQVTGRFNGIWQSKLFGFVDESFWAGDKSSEGVLKGLITEPKITLEYKGKEAFEIDNHARFCFATNNEWAVPAGKDARRYCVLDVSNAKRGDRAYFAALSECVSGAGASSFFGFLLSMDLTGLDLRTPPVTQALVAQKVMSLDSVPAWWRERLWAGYIDNPTEPESGGEWSDVVPSARLFSSYLAYCKRHNLRYPDGEESFARKLREMADLQRKRGPRGDVGRPWQTVFMSPTPGVSALDHSRGRFESWIGGALSWEREGEDEDEGQGEAYSASVPTPAPQPQPAHPRAWMHHKAPAAIPVPDEIDLACPF